MNSLYWVVAGVIVLAVLVLFVIEILAKINNEPNDNVNELIRAWAYDKFYFITFAFGVIAGHLFLGTTNRWFDCTTFGLPESFCSIFDVIVIAVLVLVILATGLIFKYRSSNTVFHFLLLSAGLIAGHIIWSMNVFV